MQLRSIEFFHGGIAGLALWLGAACLPPVAAASPWVDPWEDVADRHEFRPFTLRYRILPHSRSDGEDVYLGSTDSGTLRFEADGAEPLPPIVVDNRPHPVQVSSLDPIAYLPDPTETAPGEETVPGDTAESTVQPVPVQERPRRRSRARLTRVHVRPPASKQGVKPSGQDREDLTISFTEIGTDPLAESPKFRYKLHGLDSEWIETSRRSVRYSNLQPGDYRFEVQAVSGSGLWSEPAGLSVQLRPVWWRQPHWILSLTVVGISLAWGFSAARTRRLLQMERLRASIAANLHDQIGAGLTDIAILSEVAARRAGDLPELSRVAATARELVDGMGDIVWLVNPRRDSLYELFLRLKDAYAELFAYAGAHLEVGDLTPFEGARLPMAYRQDLHLLFQEALRNALRHSGCRRAELSVTLRGRRLEVELRDDGRGFDPENRSGEGLETMRRRAERLGGRLRIDSSSEGTVVRFVGRIP